LLLFCVVDLGLKLYHPPERLKTFPYFYDGAYAPRFVRWLVRCVAAKLCEFNSQCDVSCQFSDADITSLEQLVSSQQAPAPAQLDTLWRIMQWPAGSVSSTTPSHSLAQSSWVPGHITWSWSHHWPDQSINQWINPWFLNWP